MRKHRRATALTLALAGGLLAAPALYAHAAGSEEGGMMGGMMQEGGPMMGGDMAEMRGMMATCTEMMRAHMQEHGAPRPNEQWRAPEGGEAPELPGEQPRQPGE